MEMWDLDLLNFCRDVNDEAPRFNQREYEVTIPENVPFGTPLANLNMEVKVSRIQSDYFIYKFHQK